MRLLALAECWEGVAATASRLQKVAQMAELLRAAQPAEAPIAVAYLAGEPRQKRLRIAWQALARPRPAAATATLELLQVDQLLEAIQALSGPGSVAGKGALLDQLLEAATPLEQRFLQALILGELRQGALQSLVGDAVVQATGVGLRQLRRAAMLAGDLVVVAVAALEHGEAGLDSFRLDLGSPIQPMLAQSARSLDEALARVGAAAVEWKLDGIRIQVHRQGDQVAAFTRTLEPIGERVPELQEAVAALASQRLILDGELIALRPDGRPRPFQETSARVAFRGDPRALRREVPLTPFFFDLLHLDGDDLVDRPLRERIAIAERVLPPTLTVPRILPASPEQAHHFLESALGRGHEGVMVKALDQPYQAGRRGAGWVKVKPHHTLDLVVLAAEWGHGRRQGLLSNLHLGARDGRGGYVMLGKTFKGLTDQLLHWQTERLLELEVGRRPGTVVVAPRLVVEVAFDGVQSSPRYPGGVTLRFARVVRYRGDKGPEAADTLEAVRQLQPT
ncbi:MAG: ATP-dependent DNA ligase [Candidatus Dormibacteria bacterium]